MHFWNPRAPRIPSWKPPVRYTPKWRAICFSLPHMESAVQKWQNIILVRYLVLPWEKQLLKASLPISRYFCFCKLLCIRMHSAKIKLSLVHLKVKVVPYTFVCRGVRVREDTYPGPSAFEVEWPVPFLAAFISPVLSPGTHLLLGGQWVSVQSGHRVGLEQ